MDRETTRATSQGIRFLHDEAATEDAFGPHGRIAELIADAICVDPSLRILGLLAPWGSGKSTVVGFVESALKARSDVDYEVFTFDAWLNQGDSPRRAFLEALVRFVSDKGLTPEKDWTEQLQRITGRLEVTRTIDTPLNTRLATGIRLAVPVAALGAGMLVKSSDIGSLWNAASVTTRTGTGLLLTLPAALVLYYIASRPTWKFWTAKFFDWRNWFTRAEPYRDEVVTSLLLLKTGAQRQSRIYRDPTPSSIEFQEIVHEILTRLAANKKRLLVVIDNLDRLPEDEALGLWAVIRTFFLGEHRPVANDADEPEAGAENAGAGDASRATILLPIDEKAVQQLYAQTSKGDDDARARAESFMDKTFDLTLRLPRPAFLDWQGYVATQLRYMFGEMPHGDAVQIITRLLDEHFLASNAPVTPRRINAILNRIGLAWLQWKHEDFAFASIAWYAIDQATIDSNVMAAVASRAPVAVFDANWQKSLAAMHFGVSGANAMSLLIEAPLRRAIDEQDVSAFEEAHKLSGFVPVLARVLEETVRNQNAPQRQLVNATLLVDRCIGDDEPLSRHLWSQLSVAATTSVVWSSFRREDAEAALLIRRQMPEAGRVDWQQALVTRLQPAIESSMGISAAPSVALMLKGFSLDGARPFNIPGDGEFFTALVADLDDHPSLPCLRTRASAEQLGLALSSDFANTTFGGGAADTRIRGLFAWGQNVDWSDSVKQAQNLLLRGAPNKSGNALLLIGLLQQTQPAAYDAVKWLAQQNALANRLSDAFVQEDLPTAARAIALGVLASPEQIPGHFTENLLHGTWETLASTVHQTLDEFGLSDFLGTARLAYIATTCPALAAVLKPVVQHRVREWRVLTEPMDDLLANAESIRGLVGQSAFDATLHRLASTEAFTGALAQLTLGGQVEFVLEAMVDDHDHIDIARKELRERASRFELADWAELVWTGDRFVELLTSMKVIAETTNTLRQALVDALSSPHLVTAAGAVDRWLGLASLLSPNNANTVFAALRDQLLERSPTVPLIPFLMAPGTRILIEPAFMESADVMVPLLAGELVTDPDNHDVVRHVLGDMGILIRLGGTEAKRAARVAVGSLYSSHDRQSRMFGVMLRNAWKLKTPEGPAPETA